MVEKGTSGRMSSRQRVVTALSHREPDRIPIDFGGRHTSIHFLVQREVKEYLGIQGGEEIIRSHHLMVVEADPRLRETFGYDVLSFEAGKPDGWELHIDHQTNTFLDEWGNLYGMPPGGCWYDVVKRALAEADLEGIKHFRYPDPANPGRTRGLRDRVQQARQITDKAIMMCNATGGIWEHSLYLRGVQQAFTDLALDRRLAETLADRNLEWISAYWTNVLDVVGDLVDVVQLGEDMGSQVGLFFSPTLYRNIYKPKLRRLVDTIRARTKAKIYLHSCGSVHPLIPDWIECGIEILNPVQVGAAGMVPAELKREFGRDLTFWGGGCHTGLLMNGTPQQVAEEVRRRIRELGPGGGYVLGSIHNIQPGVPARNVVTMFQTALRAGIYPLDGGDEQ